MSPLAVIEYTLATPRRAGGSNRRAHQVAHNHRRFRHIARDHRAAHQRILAILRSDAVDAMAMSGPKSRDFLHALGLLIIRDLGSADLLSENGLAAATMDLMSDGDA